MLSAADNSSSTSASWAARCCTALALGAAFWLSGHSFTESRKILQEGSVLASRVENRYATAQKSAHLDSAIGYFLVGAVGVMCCLSAPSWRLDWLSALAVLGLAYVAWCAASLLWSAEPGLSLRKLAILGLLYAGAVGVATRFDLEDLLWIAVLLLGGYVALGVAAEAACGTLRPWRSDYRFAGTCHPNDQGLQCALLALAASFITWRQRRRPWLQAALMGIGLIGLAMTKSRTTLAAAVAALALVLVLRSRGLWRWIALCGGASALCMAGLAMSFSSVAELDQAADVAAMGRRENVSSLSGRLPLWQEAWQDAAQRPALGYGYGAFWGEKNVLKYSKRFAWHIPHAHNAYIDHVLATGVIGAALYLAWIGAVAAAAATRAERSSRPAEQFVACLILFSLVHGLSESKLPGVGAAGFILLASIAGLTIRPPRLAAAVAAPLAAPSAAECTRPVSKLTGRPQYAPALRLRPPAPSA